MSAAVVGCCRFCGKRATTRRRCALSFCQRSSASIIGGLRLFSDNNKNDTTTTTTTTTTTGGFCLPDPTWSLEDLELTSKNEPISMEEFERLAKKSNLDITEIKDIDSLRVDLANMLHCLEQIKQVELPEMTEEEIYDVPRGVTAAPLRRRTNNDDESTTTSSSSSDADEAKQVWKSLLKPKTTVRNGQDYFAVVTKRDDTVDKE